MYSFLRYSYLNTKIVFFLLCWLLGGFFVPLYMKTYIRERATALLMFRLRNVRNLLHRVLIMTNFYKFNMKISCLLNSIPCLFSFYLFQIWNTSIFCYMCPIPISYNYGENSTVPNSFVISGVTSMDAVTLKKNRSDQKEKNVKIQWIITLKWEIYT